MDASLRLALEKALQESGVDDDDDDDQAQDDKAMPQGDPYGKSPPLPHPDGIQWTSYAGTVRGRWIEAKFDDAQGTWRANVDKARRASTAAAAATATATASAAAAATVPPRTASAEERAAWDSTPDEVLREIARLRRKLRLLQSEEKRFVARDREDTDQDDAEKGSYGVNDTSTIDNDDDDDDDDMDLVPPEGHPNEMLPGAFRVGGGATGEDGDDDRSVASAPLPPRPAAAAAVTRMPRSTVLTMQGSSGGMLLEANLVVEPETFEAKPIRRRRQILFLTGIVVLSCTVVALAVGIPLSRPDPPRTPDYDFVQVGNLQEAFNQSLPNSTLETIQRGATPQARAYDWLFGTGGDVKVPAKEGVARTLHRFRACHPLLRDRRKRHVESQYRVARQHRARVPLVWRELWERHLGFLRLVQKRVRYSLSLVQTWQRY